MRKPNLFIAEAQRSGTTSLYNYLKLHPQIFLTVPKEPHHFSTDLYKESIIFAKQQGKSIRRVNNYFKYIDEESYFSLFNNSNRERVIGEVSADYLYANASAKIIYQFNPDAKIIIIFRNLIEQIFSWYFYLKRHFNCFRESFAETLKKERKKGRLSYPICFRRPSSLHYSDIGNHSKQIERYLNYFLPSQIKIILFTNLKNNLQSTYLSIITFLEFKKFDSVEFNKYNSSRLIFSLS